MRKLEFRTITDKDGIENVLNIVERYSGVRLPLDYANRNKVVGAFSQNKLVATYMVVTQPNFRSLMFVPSDNWKNTDLSVTDDYDMMEINGLWISPSLKTPLLQARIWAHLIKDIFMSKKKYVLLMRDSRNKIMERFLNMANPTTLYDGPPMLMAGATSHERIQVSYTTRWQIVLNSHKYIGEISNRMKRAREFEKSRSFSSPTSNNGANLA
ncbi:MAG: hypothetical protein ACJATW_002501 [Glaciecola sp.]|jgi:hypothetical protein